MSKEDTSSPSRAELLTSQFYEWEIRGRGWHLWEHPVELEPPFRPFWSHWIPGTGVIDDARKPTLLSSLSAWVVGRSQSDNPALEEEDESEPEPIADTDWPDIVEFQIAVPPPLKISKEVTELFFFSLDVCGGPVSFEVLADGESITVQMAVREGDALPARDQLTAYFPEAVLRERREELSEIWDTSGEKASAVVDFGLSDEFMLPLAIPKNLDLDPLIAVVGALAAVGRQEFALLQILFAPVRSNWASSVIRSVTDGEGKSFFADAPEMLALAREKVSRPLFATVVRIAAQSSDEGRTDSIIRGIRGALTQFSNPTGNSLIPLSDDGYPEERHIADVLSRRSHRSGMILNSEELASVAHLPSVAVRSAKLARVGDRTKALPTIAVGTGLVLGENTHAGLTTDVSLTPQQRIRHTYVLGASGTGKSTFLLNCILQDIRNGEGIGVLDPHGDLIDRVLESIPEERARDVVLVDPSDEEYPVGFNILSAHSELEKTLLSSDLVSVFRRLSTSWGDQMTSVLGNAVLAFLESDRGGTLVDLRRFLVESNFRTAFLETVQDSEVAYFWKREFPLLSGKPQAPLLTRLDTFLRPKLIRRMVGQKENKLDFRHIMDGRKIFLAKLSQGAIGEENSYLLGTLLVAKLHQTAIGRQDIKESARKPFYIYIDEFQNFITPSMASILSGARKYGMGLVLAHQDLRQLWNEDTQVASSIIANAHTRVCFRLGDFDAAKLQEGFSFFTAADLQNLSIGEAICRIERAEYDFNLKTLPLPPITEGSEMRRQKVVEYSRSQYAKTREDVEREFETVLPTPIPRLNADQPRAAPEEQIQPVPERTADLPVKGRQREPQPMVPVPAMPGRGGAQHKYLQQLVKRMAEAQGYRATIEKEILGGVGKIDVALERGEEKVACEISVTSTGEHELANVQKCIAAGYQPVLMLSTDKKALTRIQDFISPQLEPDVLESVSFLLPEELLSYMEHAQATAASSQQTIRGYRVKVNYQAVGEQEKKTKKEAISNVIVQAMRRLKG